MNTTEVPVCFTCEGEQLLGICHIPDSAKSTGVVIVVGGPQYRVGSHRQFVLLARHLAEQGLPVFRFDYRGMGDSSGALIDFEQVTPDIRAAIDIFMENCPQLQKVVLWGLCDAASAIMLYALVRDPRVAGQILLNPWVRTDEGVAKVYLKNYYAKRILDKELWIKIFRGGFNYRDSLTGLVSAGKKACKRKTPASVDENINLLYTERMLLGMESFSGKSLLLLSGNDLTADEFRQHVAHSKKWQMVLSSLSVAEKTLAEANHTFSKAVWRDQVAQWTGEWIMGGDMKKILLIAFHFPPVKGSSGLHRALSMAKYLPDYAWQPAVLTAASRAYENTSSELLKEIPVSLPVTRAFALDATRHLSFKGRYFQWCALPDRWSSWWLGAICSWWQQIKKQKPSLLWSTYPIATAHLIGLSLHKLTGIPWVADFRDSMTEDNYPNDPKIRAIYRWIEKKTVQNATKVVFTTSGALEMYADRYPEIARGKWAVIENAVDEDFVSLIEKELKVTAVDPDRKLRFVHSGILYPSERDPTQFFKALSQLKKQKVLSSTAVEFILRASTNEEAYRKHVKQLDVDDLVFFEPAIPYAEAIREMLLADGLLIFQAGSCNHQIPAKIYEYFRSGRPILGLTDPTGNTAELLASERGTMIARLDDEENIVLKLPEFITYCREQRGNSVRAASGKYSRRTRIQQYSEIFNQMSGEFH